VNLSWPIRAAIKFIFNFLDSFQQQQLSFYGTDFAKDLLTKINPSNFETKYGGTAANVAPGNFWPS